ncbi:glyoxylate/hydroxypyruvate reductase B [bacterium BMS3Bbin11]|nr:glyoxylate/hydroxypyruvate reductase B [bacterium BMS3Abin11]GBE45216.1 glyoxylate/hydroxypyruvate reductase B [bacterium BMS3Bbin11]HDH08859.1 phosphoglycerate dehydrogenase [Gammaproteobacteria bacterium]HDH16558.1 phosphoglycerate dehydrogenase [Gammaproteobacteria bacterium]HDZ79463.1 phosphoglycerate dehydrogenase [Gammaproteobacteria bacterium]
MKVLVTCPPMLGMIDSFRPLFEQSGVDLTTPEVVQTLSVEELKELVPQHDGWIIGDDPATREVFTAGKAGQLKAAVKWGIGVDNVDFDACENLEIPIINTPDMFGAEVADIAVGYVVALARETFEIDRGVREGQWPKPRGISLSGKTVALVGFGDIGRNTAKRLLAAEMQVIAYDPFVSQDMEVNGVKMASWPDRVEEADYIVVTSSLTLSSYHMVNSEVFAKAKQGVRVVNVGRGPVIDEQALVESLKTGKVYSAALDVFEAEPLPLNSYLRTHPHCVFGSHNASNTTDAVERTSFIAIQKLFGYLGISA